MSTFSESLIVELTSLPMYLAGLSTFNKISSLNASFFINYIPQITQFNNRKVNVRINCTIKFLLCQNINIYKIVSLKKQYSITKYRIWADCFWCASM